MEKTCTLTHLSVGYESIAEIGIMTDLADKEKAAQALSNRQSVRITTFNASPLREIQYLWSIKSTKIR